MVLVWNYLVRGNDGLTLVMVAINSLTMLLLYGVRLGGWLLGLNEMPVPWETLLLSVGIGRGAAAAGGGLLQPPLDYRAQRRGVVPG